MAILKGVDRNSIVFDPFCGRGTTNFAAQTYGMKSYGFDASPIATSIAKAKLANTNMNAIRKLLEKVLAMPAVATPSGEFWEWAFHPDTLQDICKLRTYLSTAKNTNAVIMLRAIALGCLHGPLTRDLSNPSYFSNQMPRTFSTKPNYSVKYWRQNKLTPFHIDIRKPILKKAQMVLQYVDVSPSHPTNIVCTDSRKVKAYQKIKERIDVVISSPPYYGMQTYVQDQWLRNWFVGGPENVDYDIEQQVSHVSPSSFASSLAEVWNNIAAKASDDIKMIIRFGGLGSKKGDYDAILRESFSISNDRWLIYYSKDAGTANLGKRQADSMGTRAKSTPISERDYFIRRD